MNSEVVSQVSAILLALESLKQIFFFLFHPAFLIILKRRDGPLLGLPSLQEAKLHTLFFIYLFILTFIYLFIFICSGFCHTFK